MLDNRFKIWQIVLLIPAILAVSGQIVFAESSSASYKAVDFVNPEASLSTSGSYKLNDSVDYYGGIHSSAGYTECTGDFAVLSNCGQVVVTPPTPPAPPSGGGGGGGCTSGCSGAGDVETFGKPPSSNPPVDESPTPIIPKKPFVLPNIKEPIPKPVEPSVIVKPVEVKEVIVPVIKDADSQDVSVLIKNVESEVVNIIAPKLNCEDLVCLESNLLRPAAKKTQPAICKVYSFGGFGFDIDCQNLLMIWLVLGLSALFVMPFGVHIYRKKNLK